MNKRLTRRKVLLWLCALLPLLLAAILCVGYFLLQVPLFSRSGWSTTPNGEIQYLDYYGKPLTHWQSIDGKNYYFDDAGKLQTGWLEQGGSRIYLGADGMVQTGWLELPEGTYFLDQAGRPSTGWIEDNGLKYYLREDGTLHEGWKDTGDGLTYVVDGKKHTGWLDVPEGKFYFDSDGTSRSGWVTDETGRFYLNGDGTYATGFVKIGGVERYFLPTGEYVLLCNRWNPVPDDFENNLVSIGNYKIDATCRDALQKMLDDGNAAGHTTKILVSYRSKATQESLRASRKKKYIAQGMTEAEAVKKVEESVAVPGTSEHQTGLAVDITGTQKMYDWLANNSWKYGFILRYPDNKIEITGIKYEPWHFRYVGKSLAKDIFQSGLCLEEYLEKLKKQ